MLPELKFTATAVAKKDYVPELQYFSIAQGRVTGFNGSLCISSPIDLDIDAYPKAGDFIKAIAACTDETTAITKTAAGRLSIKSGPFKTLVNCVDQQPEFPLPAGSRHMGILRRANIQQL